MKQRLIVLLYKCIWYNNVVEGIKRSEWADKKGLRKELGWLSKKRRKTSDFLYFLPFREQGFVKKF